MSKIKPVINFLNQKFKEVYIMKKDISIDESLMKFRGRISNSIHPKGQGLASKFINYVSQAIVINLKYIPATIKYTVMTALRNVLSKSLLSQCCTGVTFYTWTIGILPQNYL